MISFSITCVPFGCLVGRLREKIERHKVTTKNFFGIKVLAIAVEHFPPFLLIWQSSGLARFALFLRRRYDPVSVNIYY